MTQRFSENGWPAYADTKRFTKGTAELQGGTGLHFWAANDDVRVVLKEYIERHDREVEPVAGPILDDWSFANRLVRGSSSVVSNHGSATAVDLNALKHPRGVENTFPLAKVAAIQNIRRSITDNNGDPVLRWGGDFRSTVDDMHVEINASAARVKQAADKIRKRDANVGAEVAMTDTERDQLVQAILSGKTKILGQQVDGVLHELDLRSAGANLEARAKAGVAPLVSEVLTALSGLGSQLTALQATATANADALARVEAALQSEPTEP